MGVLSQFGSQKTARYLLHSLYDWSAKDCELFLLADQYKVASTKWRQHKDYCSVLRHFVLC